LIKAGAVRSHKLPLRELVPCHRPRLPLFRCRIITVSPFFEYLK
jgi:hypothetical protein